MDLQLSIPASAKVFSSPTGPDTQDVQLPDGAQPDATSPGFARLLANAMPHGAAPTATGDAEKPLTAYGDGSASTAADASAAVASLLAAAAGSPGILPPIGEENAKSRQAKVGEEKDAVKELTGPVIANFMPTRPADPAITTGEKNEDIDHRAVSDTPPDAAASPMFVPSDPEKAAVTPQSAGERRESTGRPAINATTAVAVESRLPSMDFGKAAAATQSAAIDTGSIMPARQISPAESAGEKREGVVYPDTPAPTAVTTYATAAAPRPPSLDSGKTVIAAQFIGKRNSGVDTSETDTTPQPAAIDAPVRPMPAGNEPVVALGAAFAERKLTDRGPDISAPTTDRLALSSFPMPAVQQRETAPVTQIQLSAPLGSHDWDNQLGQRVVWMSNQQNHVADIRINPPELGPVELRLTLDGQQSGQNATLHFISPHPEVREAIENSMPRLREIMADAGITLGNATVGSESFHQPQASAQERQSSNTSPAVPFMAATATESSPVAQRSGNGLVDTFA